MLAYSVIFIFLCFCTYYYDVLGRVKNRGLSYWLIFISLILLAGLRYRVGGDTLSYFDDYPTFPAFSEFASTDFSLLPYELFFYVLVAIAKLFGDDFFYFQLLHAFIVNIVVFSFLRRYVKYRFAGVLLYYLLVYFYFNMEIMRESLAICFFLLSVKYLIAKKYVPYYLICCVSLFFHLSATFLLILPILYSLLRKNRKYIWGVLLTVMLVFITISQYPEILLLFPLKLSLKIYNYISIGPMSTGGAILYFIHALVLFIIVSLGKRYTVDSEKFLPFLLINILIYCSSSYISGFYRITNYFVLFEIIVLLNVWSSLAPRWRTKQYSYGKLMLAFAFLLILKLQHATVNTGEYATGTRFYNLYIPYETVFSEKRHRLRENIYYVGMDIEKKDKAERRDER